MIARRLAQHGMGRIEQTFTTLRKEGRRALVVYLTAGDPDLQISIDAARAALEAGADILEIGVPFSDPLADGPVIQRAMTRALAAGGGMKLALDMVRELRRDFQVPMVVFGYANPFLLDGEEVIAHELATAGADGVLVVDLPLEEADPLRKAGQAYGLDWVSLVAPTTGEKRIQRIAQDATGFLYMVSMTGVTGAKLSGITHLNPILERIRETSPIPICIGFGVRDKSTAMEAARIADGVVVGSAIVAALEGASTKRAGVDAVRACVRELRAGVDSV